MKRLTYTIPEDKMSYKESFIEFANNSNRWVKNDNIDNDKTFTFELSDDEECESFKETIEEKFPFLYW